MEGRGKVWIRESLGEAIGLIWMDFGPKRRNKQKYFEINKDR